MKNAKLSGINAEGYMSNSKHGRHTRKNNSNNNSNNNDKKNKQSEEKAIIKNE